MTRNEVTHANTGSIVSSKAVCVGGSTDCAQLCIENAAAVASTAAIAKAINSLGVQSICGRSMNGKLTAMNTAQKPTCNSASG